MGSEDEGRKQTVAVKLDPSTVDEIDEMVDGKNITNRSQAIRELIEKGIEQSDNKELALRTAKASTVAGALGVGNSITDVVTGQIRGGVVPFAFVLVGILGIYAFAWVKT